MKRCAYRLCLALLWFFCGSALAQVIKRPDVHVGDRGHAPHTSGTPLRVMRD